MKFLVKKWKRATRVGSSIYASNTHSQNGASYIPSSNGFSSPRQRGALVEEPSHSIPSYSTQHTPPRRAMPHQSDRWEQNGIIGANATHRPTFTTPPTKDSMLRRYVLLSIFCFVYGLLYGLFQSMRFLLIIWVYSFTFCLQVCGGWKWTK